MARKKKQKYPKIPSRFYMPLDDKGRECVDTAYQFGRVLFLSSNPGEIMQKQTEFIGKCVLPVNHIVTRKEAEKLTRTPKEERLDIVKKILHKRLHYDVLFKSGALFGSIVPKVSRSGRPKVDWRENPEYAMMVNGAKTMVWSHILLPLNLYRIEKFNYDTLHNAALVSEKIYDGEIPEENIRTQILYVKKAKTPTPQEDIREHIVELANTARIVATYAKILDKNLEYNPLLKIPKELKERNLKELQRKWRRQFREPRGGEEK